MICRMVQIICNPPYGERIGEIKECEKLYKEIGKSFNALDISIILYCGKRKL